MLETFVAAILAMVSLAALLAIYLAPMLVGFSLSFRYRWADGPVAIGAALAFQFFVWIPALFTVVITLSRGA